MVMQALFRRPLGPDYGRVRPHETRVLFICPSRAACSPREDRSRAA